MKDTELIKEFIRVEQTKSGVQILICKIGWSGPHTPVSTWVVGKSFLAEVSEAEIRNASAGMLDDPHYFRSCRDCGERQPVGWMHDECVCQGCAERNHGVVH